MYVLLIEDGVFVSKKGGRTSNLLKARVFKTEKKALAAVEGDFIEVLELKDLLNPE